MEKLHNKKRKWNDLVRNVEDREGEKTIDNDGGLGHTKESRRAEATIDAQKAGARDPHFGFGFGVGESSDEEVP